MSRKQIRTQRNERRLVATRRRTDDKHIGRISTETADVRVDPRQRRRSVVRDVQ